MRKQNYTELPVQEYETSKCYLFDSKFFKIVKNDGKNL